MPPSSRAEPTWVPIVVVMAAQHEQLLEHGGRHGIRDRGVLESVLDRARNRYAYEPGADLATLAACHAYGLATTQAFNDGNKRAAYLTAAIFLDLNGYHLAHEDSDIVRIMFAVAERRMSEGDLAAWFRSAMVPAPRETGR
jgi:death-on-curing protein